MKSPNMRSSELLRASRWLLHTIPRLPTSCRRRLSAAARRAPQSLSLGSFEPRSSCERLPHGDERLSPCRGRLVVILALGALVASQLFK
jgi:hypothetical protein